MKKTIRVVAVRSLALLLSLVLILPSSGCLSFVIISAFKDAPEEQISPTPPPPPEVVIEAEGKYNDLSFDELCDVLFEHEVTYDNLSLNQLVTDPEKLSLEVPRPATLGNRSLASTEEDNRFYSEIIEALSGEHTIDISALSDKQRLEAEYIEAVLRLELRFEDFFYYFEPLSPSTGSQAQLPLSFMDYSFRSIEDIEIYLEILEDVPRYFDQLIDNQKEKQSLNLLMARESMEDSIKEARAYAGSIEGHILVSSFDEMLDSALADATAQAAATDAAASTSTATDLASLTPEKVQEYKQSNRNAIERFLIPAYEKLISELESLVSSCTRGVRLFDYPRGTEFYEMVMESMGFDQGASAAALTLDIALEEYSNTIAIYAGNKSFEEMIPESVVQLIGDSPEDYITFIQERSTHDFASAHELAYQIKVAPDASPNDYAMAYFLIPPVDNPQQNSIVFFPRNISDDVELFSTMAHEGYPGHMYQIYAYSLENPSNISKILGSTAYMEGWAMYAQSQAIGYLDTNPQLIEAYIAYEKFLYGLQARVDIGINYEGWSIDKTKDYLADWGYETAAQALYDSSIKQPVAYLPYGIGVIEFDYLRERAEEQLDENFSAAAFHQRITSMGPIPFNMLEREFETWLKSSDTQQI